MAGVLPALLPLLLVAIRVAAQAGPYCDESLNYLKNALGQDPCHVASYLMGQCYQDFPFGLTTLGDTYSGYGGPDDSNTTSWALNACLCSMPVYNLLSACQNCQGKAVFPWTEYSFNCTQTFTGSAITPTLYFPSDIPNGTEIPAWAQIDNSQTPWSQSQAFSNVSNSVPSTPASDAASAGGSSSSSHHSDAGVIAGATIGGVAGAGLIALAALYFLKHRGGHSKSGAGGEKQAGLYGDPARNGSGRTTTPGAATMGRISPFVFLRGRTPGGRTATPASTTWGGAQGSSGQSHGGHGQHPSVSGASTGYGGYGSSPGGYGSSPPSSYPMAIHRGPGGQPHTPEASQSGSVGASYQSNPFESGRYSQGYPTTTPSSSSHGAQGQGLRPGPGNARSSYVLPEIQSDDYSRPDVYHSYPGPSQQGAARGNMVGLRPRGDG